MTPAILACRNGRWVCHLQKDGWIWRLDGVSWVEKSPGELRHQGTPERTSIASSLRIFAAGGGSGLFFKIRAAMLQKKTSAGRYPRVAGYDSDILEYRLRRAGVRVTRERLASQRTGTLLSVVQERRHKLWIQMLEVGEFGDKKSRWLLFFVISKNKQTNLWSIFMLIKPQRALKQPTLQNDHCHPWHYQKCTFDFQGWQISIFKGVQVIQIIFLVWRRKI